MPFATLRPMTLLVIAMATTFIPIISRAADLPSQEQAEPNTVTLRSLLEEMVRQDAIARWPALPFTQHQASSYDRHRTGPNAPGWFENNDHSNYIRIETYQGREERVMMDADGPGAIVRFFRTNGGSMAARTRIYLDGSDTPTLEWDTTEAIDGMPGIDAPLRSSHPQPDGHGGTSTYFPIPYAKHCKVTIEEREPKQQSARYYQINYRTYAPGTVVKTFTRADLEASRPVMDRVNRLLVAPPVPHATKSVSGKQILAPGAELTVDLPSGAFAVRQLELHIAPDASEPVREQALRSVVLRGAFDDEPESIWCPVGDFAGSGVGGRLLASWYRTVDGRGNSVSRWPMPYRKSGKLTLQNLGTVPAPVEVIARIAPWVWDDRSLYFHCNWRQQVQIPSLPYQDWNFNTMTGRGVLVGDVLSVFNPIPSWYGEGNEKIWTDGEAFPSNLGTGTEDYYNASWAPNPVFQTPFSSQPRIDEARSQGNNVYTRSRNLDGIPFEKSLKFDFEIMTWKESRVDYAATTYWYGAPGARSNLAPQPDEARRPVPSLPPPLVLPGAIECETLAVVGHGPDVAVGPQTMEWATTGKWSANAHLLIAGKKVGDYVELSLPATGNKPRRLTLYATQANDYGIVKFTINGRPVSATFDGYAPTLTALVPIPLGVFTPLNGKFLLRAEIIGTNSQAVGARYLAGLDAVIVSK